MSELRLIASQPLRTTLRAQETTLHVDVKLVNVFVNVTDQNGAIVGGLTRDDFAITEDGRPQADLALRAPVGAALEP